jgi:phage gpG-like protein
MANKNISQLQADINRLHREIKQFPFKAAHIVEEYSHGAFRNTKWDGQTWKKRKAKNPNDRRNPDKPRALMVQSRALQRSIKVDANATQVRISSNVRYAKTHNEGETIKHPGGTPYLPFNSRHGARKTRGRIGSMGGNQMVFIKKSQMSKYPQAKLTKPHNIPIPKRQFMGYSAELMSNIGKELDAIIEKKP